MNTIHGWWRQVINAAVVVLLISFAPTISAGGDEDRADAAAKIRLGQAFYALGRYQKAIGWFENALAIDLKTVGKNHPKTAT